MPSFNSRADALEYLEYVFLKALVAAREQLLADWTDESLVSPHERLRAVDNALRTGDHGIGRELKVMRFLRAKESSRNL
jgi:hypothetical protein